MRFLVTAGSTRQPIDKVRDWGNIFTGNTGYDIARELMKLGVVDLFTSNKDHLARVLLGQFPNLRAYGFSSHADLKAGLETVMLQEQYDAVFMTAAVSDYNPAGAYALLDRKIQDDGTEIWTVKNAQAGKVKSNFDQVAIRGERTEKIVDLFRTQWDHKGILVKFKLEVDIPTERLLQIGQESRAASGADYLVANTLAMVAGETPGAYLISNAEPRWISRKDLPVELAKLVVKR
jgi:phosphopantothenoylcysteine synthetase/decarboxylase